MAKKQTGRIRVLLVDDHEVVRTGLKLVLNRYPEIDVVGEADGLENALAMTEAERPNVVLMDLRLKRENGVDVCRRIRDRLPRTRVLMLTAFADESLLLGSILAGAHGYVLKEVNSRDLYTAVKRVTRVSWKTPDRSRLLRKGLLSKREKSSSMGDADLLAGQETRLLDKVYGGASNREIGRDLGLGEQVVRQYLIRILDRLRISVPPDGACLFQPVSTSRPIIGAPQGCAASARTSRPTRSAPRRSR